MAATIIHQAPTRMLTRMNIVLTMVGIVILTSLLVEAASPIWSRPALVLQGLALLLALVVYRRIRQYRYLLYPLLLAAAIYLWDGTLPPPTLPDGLPREFIPPIVVVGVIMHFVYTAWQRPRRPRHIRRIVPVFGGYIELAPAAQLFQLSPAQLRARLLRAGRFVYIDDHGTEYTALRDLQAVLRDPPGQDR